MAVILGLPKPHADRIKGELKKGAANWREGWSVHFIPPTGAGNLIRESDIRTALRTAEESDAPHVFAITNQGGERKAQIVQHFLPYFRFRWLPGAWLSLPYPSPIEFVLKVNETFEDEEDWRARVQPLNYAHPLLLPNSGFTTKLSDLWELAWKYGDGCNTGTARRINDFSKAHRKPHASGSYARDYYWTDADQRIFDHTQQQHGQAPGLRAWKYSYRMPEGFHYDVRHAEGRKFTVTGAMRVESVKAGGYVNLDPHGHFRD